MAALFEYRTARLALALCAGVGGVLTTAWWFGFPRIGIDDANITFVYARNLAAGHGLVFTPGYERVEGFTSAGWMLLCAVAYGISPSPERIVLALSALLCACALAAMLECVHVLCGGRRGTRPRPPDPLPWALAVGWLGVIPAFYAWNGPTLMDVALWSAAVGGLAWALLHLVAGRGEGGRGPLWLAAACALAVITRPEAMAYVPFALLVGAVCVRTRCDGWRSAARPFLPAAVAFGVVLAALVCFRLVYFGYPLPNTYYAKLSPDRLYNAVEGATYLYDFVRNQPLVIPGLAAGLVLLGLAPRALSRFDTDGETRAAIAASALLAGGLGLQLVRGGDHMGSSRLCQPFVPLVILPLTFSLARLWPVERRRGAPNAALVAAVLGLAAVAGIEPWKGFRRESRMQIEFSVALRGRLLGRLWNAVSEPGARPAIGEIAAGGLGLVYEGRVVDLVGLNWTAMGHAEGDRRGPRNHAAFDPGVFWTEPPEIVNLLFYRRRPEDVCRLEGNNFRSRVLEDIWETARFRERYAGAWFRVPRGFEGPGGRRYVGAFMSRDWLARSAPDGIQVFSEHCGPTRSD